jgi:hypothetical protein
VGALRIDRRRQLAQDAPLGPGSPTGAGSSGLNITRRSVLVWVPPPSCS